MGFLEALWSISLEVAPWLVLGLVAAGLVRAFLPPAVIVRWLSGRGVGSAVRAALAGAPIPLCSCSVIPMAAQLRRQGASRGATASFLVSTPETGVDSIALSYALLGPFLAVARPVAAVITAITTGVLVELTPAPQKKTSVPLAQASCCESKRDAMEEPAPSCCVTEQRDEDPARGSFPQRLVGGVRYAFTTLYADIVGWLALGVLMAAVLRWLVDPQAFASWGGGVWSMLGLLAVSVPMYTCATASTPLAAAMLVAGFSPGAVLVFLLAGPATNIATIAVVRSELGTRAMWAYVGSIVVISLAFGLLTDLLVSRLGLAINPAEHAHAHRGPEWLAISALALLIALGAGPVWRAVRGIVHREEPSPSPAR